MAGGRVPGVGAAVTCHRRRADPELVAAGEVEVAEIARHVEAAQEAVHRFGDLQLHRAWNAIDAGHGRIFRHLDVMVRHGADRTGIEIVNLSFNRGRVLPLSLPAPRP